MSSSGLMSSSPFMLAVTSAFDRGVANDKPVVGQETARREGPVKLTVHQLSDAVDEYALFYSSD